MNLEEFAGSDSLIQRLDPRVKIVVATLFSVVVAVSTQFVALVSALALGLCVVWLSRVPIRELARRLVPVNMLIIILWFFLPFTVEGKTFCSAGPLVATYEGISYAGQITIKSNAIMLVLIALIASTSIFTLGHAMHELKVPKKIVHLFFFTYRYIHVIYREYVRLGNAMKVRGFRPRNNMHTYRTFACLVGMLLVRSCERAQRVHNAMLCRGFRGAFYSLSDLSFRGTDAISLVLMLAAILALAVLEWTRIT